MYIESGRRRDLCVLLYAADNEGLRGQELKARLESHYDRRIEPREFYGSLDALVDADHVERIESGIHDRYRLTGAGEQALEAHYHWMQQLIDP